MNMLGGSRCSLIGMPADPCITNALLYISPPPFFRLHPGHTTWVEEGKYVGPFVQMLTSARAIMYSEIFRKDNSQNFEYLKPEIDYATEYKEINSPLINKV